MLPLVVILDLDGTVIGDITPQIVTYDIKNEIKKTGDKLICKGKDLEVKLRSGIIRPYFVEFINTLKKQVPNIEFYVYTASEKKWAFYMIKNIEKALGIKFNKPLFTRSNCFMFQNEYKKSLKYIKKPIYKSLKNKYGLVSTDDLNNRILIIDNMDVYQSNEKQYHVLCDTYDFKYPENIGAMVTKEEYEKHWRVIAKVIKKYYNIEISNDFFDFQIQYYKVYVSHMQDIIVKNKKYNNDRFFKYLKKLLIYVLLDKNYNTFNDTVVKYINRHLYRLCS